MNFNELNRATYERIGHEFSATRHYLWADLALLKPYVASGAKVLDLGCGNGRLLEMLATKVPPSNYVGVDFSGTLIASARELHPQYNFEQADILQLEITGKYDVIFMVAVHNHFSPHDQQLVLAKVKSWLAPGGQLLMLNWNLWNWRSKKSVWRNHRFGRFQNVLTTWRGTNTSGDLFYYALRVGELARRISRAGLAVVRIGYTLNGEKANILTGRNIITVARNGYDHLEKKPSRISGNGIYLTKPIVRGEIVYRVPLDRIRYENYCRHAYIGNGQYVCDMAVLNVVNHSCEPSCRLDIERLDPCLIALRDLNIGEEVTCNYDVTEVDGLYRVCTCGTPSCRGHFGRVK